MRRAWTSVFVVALGCALGCGSGEAHPPDAGVPDAAPRGQGNEPRGDLAVNEVGSAVYGSPDYIELVNRGLQAVDLSGWYVTDAADRLDHYYTFPAGTSLAAGAYLVVWADDGAAGEGHHAPFELGASDGAYLIGPTGLNADSFVYLALEDGRTLSRLPDREGLFFSGTATPGGANTP